MAFPSLAGQENQSGLKNSGIGGVGEEGRGQDTTIIKQTKQEKKKNKYYI